MIAGSLITLIYDMISLAWVVVALERAKAVIKEFAINSYKVLSTIIVIMLVLYSLISAALALIADKSIYSAIFAAISCHTSLIPLLIPSEVRITFHGYQVFLKAGNSEANVLMVMILVDSAFNFYGTKWAQKKLREIIVQRRVYEEYTLFINADEEMLNKLIMRIREAERLKTVVAEASVSSISQRTIKYPKEELDKRAKAAKEKKTEKEVVKEGVSNEVTSKMEEIRTDEDSEVAQGNNLKSYKDENEEVIEEVVHKMNEIIVKIEAEEMEKDDAVLAEGYTIDNCVNYLQDDTSLEPKVFKKTFASGVPSDKVFTGRKKKKRRTAAKRNIEKEKTFSRMSLNSNI